MEESNPSEAHLTSNGTSTGKKTLNSAVTSVWERAKNGIDRKSASLEVLRVYAADLNTLAIASDKRNDNYSKLYQLPEDLSVGDKAALFKLINNLEAEVGDLDQFEGTS
jgi:hypothetical protein